MKFFIRPKGYVCYKPVIVDAENEDVALQKSTERSGFPST